ncbi:PTS glucose transporter subunit IIA, partial [uncultured Enterococcus sp.]|uniref:PTS sugar transporter subunit IIA n=1 Tax=uncultured Enterococcus sp. TaxID=167972 RepID=UPI0025D7F421
MSEVLQFLAPVTGQLLPIEQVPDPVFSQKTMGEGYGVVPIDGQIVSPVSGVIMLVADTKHAIGIKTTSGVEVLLHMGIDTVDLKGAPFKVNVSQGEEIQAGAPLATVDLEKVKA